MTRPLLPLLALLVGSAAAAGQETVYTGPTVPVGPGTLNGKAVSKPAPPYPAIAKLARARGEVVVRITVDEEGKVTSANAVSGHPLLQQAAVQAAYRARFSPTLLSGKPVKVTGTIIYNFVLRAAARFDDRGRLETLFNLTEAGASCKLGSVSGTIVAVERSQSGRVVGLTVESGGGRRAEFAVAPKLYDDLTAEELRKAEGLLSRGRRVRISLRDCGDSTVKPDVEDISALDLTESGPTT